MNIHRDQAVAASPFTSIAKFDRMWKLCTAFGRESLSP
jgi:hypothetical protein